MFNSASAPLLTHPQYRPDIDGLRAIAVLAVLAFHAFPTWLPGGFIGVDSFFIISGFLIGQIILQNLATHTFSFRQFYIRRIRRIFPALIVILSLCLLIGWWVLLSEEYQILGKHVAGGAAFVSNIILWQESGYFDTSAELKPLLHLWSLGIEEQFYLIWPILLYIGWQTKRPILYLIYLVIAISFLVNIYLIHIKPSAAFYLPFSRFWELAVGSLLAYIALFHNIMLKNITANLVAILGFVLLIASLFLLNKQMAYPGGWALLPVVSTALLIIAGTQAWINYYILSSQLLVWFGLISFPLYLWHWPLLAFARIVQADSLSLMMRLVIIILSVCLAWLTYLFIEQPLRYGKHAWRKALGLSLMLGLLGVIGGLIYTQPNLQNTRLARLVNPNIVNAIGDWAFPGGLIKREIQGVSFYANNLAAPQVLFVGDSHMDQYAPKVLALSKQHSQRSVAFVTEGGCPPIPHIYEAAHPYCPQLMERINIILQAYPSIRSIVVAGCWNCYFIEEIKSQPLPGAYQYYYRHNGQALAFRNAQGGQYALNALQVWMQQLANRYVVYLMLDNPSDARFNPNVMLGGSGGRWALTLDTQAYYQAYQPQAFFVQAEQIALNQRLMHLAYQAGAIPLNVLAEVCPQARCMPMDAQGRPLYSDQHHLRPFYVREHISVLDSVL